jgi:hypothetical protein
MGYDNLIKQSGLDKTTQAAARRIGKINKPRRKKEADRNTGGTPSLVKKQQDQNTTAAPVIVQEQPDAATTGAPKDQKQENGARVAPFARQARGVPFGSHPDVLSYRNYPREPLEIEGLSLEFMKKSCFVPLSVSDTTFEIAMADPKDYDTIDALKFAFGLKVAVTKGKPDDIRDAIESLYGKGRQSGPAVSGNHHRRGRQRHIQRRQSSRGRRESSARSGLRSANHPAGQPPDRGCSGNRGQ